VEAQRGLSRERAMAVRLTAAEIHAVARVEPFPASFRTQMVQTNGTSRITEAALEKLVRAHFELTPRGIIESLDLRRPIYKATAAYGHFGRDGFSWEKTDKAEALRSAAGI